MNIHTNHRRTRRNARNIAFVALVALLGLLNVQSAQAQYWPEDGAYGRRFLPLGPWEGSYFPMERPQMMPLPLYPNVDGWSGGALYDEPYDDQPIYGEYGNELDDYELYDIIDDIDRNSGPGAAPLPPGYADHLQDVVREADHRAPYQLETDLNLRFRNPFYQGAELRSPYGATWDRY